MTKKELSQLYKLNGEIKILRLQKQAVEDALNNLQADAITVDTVQGSSASFPFVKHPVCIEGLRGLDMSTVYKYKSELADIIKLIELNEERRIWEYRRLYRYIQDVEGTEMRQILTLRYINGMSWQQIAFKIGEQDESYPRRKHNRFLKLAENAE